MALTFHKSDLVGRTIQDVRLNRWWDAAIKAWIYEPEIILDNGRVLSFVVQETDSGASYGVEPVLGKRAGGRLP